MENATKGLMIAGAILIAIVLIGIGVFLVSQAQNFMNKGGQTFDDSAVQAFNTKFENYTGQRSGSDIRALITLVNTNNLSAASNGTYLEEGIKLVLKQLKDVLAYNGVKEIETVGKEFDPELHEAVSHVTDEKLGKTIIKEEFRKGYIIGTKVIRHSMVIVAN